MTAVVGKLFCALDCIAAAEEDTVSLARLTQSTGIPKATMYRLLSDLLDAGVVDRGHSGGYSLGTRLFELGFAVPKYRQLRVNAQSHLERLHAELGETVHLGVPVDDNVVVLEKVHGRAQRVPTIVGSRLPMYCTAMGKIILADSSSDMLHRVLSKPLQRMTPRTVVTPGMLARQLERFRGEGLATEFGETFPGVGCVAAPVVAANGEVVAAISVSGNARSLGSRVVRTMLGDAARKVSLDLEMDLVGS